MLNIRLCCLYHFPIRTDDDDSRGELHEMLVPSAFSQAWINKDNIIHLYSYFLKFQPSPKDRIYKEFGMFILTSLPVEAENMELDLHLAHGRTVMTQLVPFGITKFDKTEVNDTLLLKKENLAHDYLAFII